MKEKPLHPFVIYIKRLLNERGISYADLSEMTGVSIGTIKHVMCGNQCMTLSVADMCVLPFNIGALDTAEAETAKGVIDFVHDFNESLSVISYLNKVPVLPSMSHYADSAQQAIADFFEVAPARLVNRDKPYSGLAKGLTIFEIDDDSAAKAQSDFVLLADHLLDKLEVSHAQR